MKKRGLGENPLDWIGQQSVKTSKSQDVKTSKRKIKHTVYLSEEVSKKLKHEAVDRRMRISDLLEEILTQYFSHQDAEASKS